MKVWEVCYLAYDESVCYGFYSSFEKAEARRLALVKENRDFWTSRGQSYAQGGRDEQYTILEHELDKDTDGPR
jgi:hypothetical protein